MRGRKVWQFRTLLVFSKIVAIANMEEKFWHGETTIVLVLFHAPAHYRLNLRMAYMISTIAEVHSQGFAERMGATTIANQAAIKCQASGLPITADNDIVFVGDL